MKKTIAVLLSMLVSLGITMGAGFALADSEPDGEHEDGKYDVTLSSIPRFPVMGEEAELTFAISHDGSPEEGLMLMVMLAETEGGHHDDDAMDMNMEAEEHVEGDEHAEAEHAEADEHQEDEMVEVTTLETVPGVYVASYTFGEEGKYLVTTHIGTHAEEGADEHAEFALAVRGSPVDWMFVTVLGAVTAFLVVVVAVRNIIRKEW